MTESEQGLPWHRYLRDFRQTMRDDDEEGFRDALQDALAGDHVIRDVEAGLLIDGNIHGRAYNAMGQSTLGVSLIEAGVKWDIPKWIVGGQAALDVMLTPYDEGGLGLIDLETETAWFVGKTSRMSESKGGTVNKHLYAARTLLEAAEVFEDLGREDQAALYQRAGEAGFRKLVLGDQGPRLADFLVEDENGRPFLDSWAYYSLIDANPSRPYFLRDEGLNGHYHTFDMRLITQVAEYLGDDFDFAPFRVESAGGLTPLSAMLQVWDNKRDTGGPEVDTPTPLGVFHAWDQEKASPPGETTIAWFEQFRLEARIEGDEGADRLIGTSADEVIMGWEGDDLLRGARGDDRVRGGDGDDFLLGGGGGDSLHGGAGADTLVGAGGDDDLIGGTGADVFAFLMTGGTDIVRDFGPGDLLALDDPAFGGSDGTTTRRLDPSAFALAGAGPLTPDHRVLYDQTTGELRVDADGSGPRAAKLLAMLSDAPTLAADDILLF